MKTNRSAYLLTATLGLAVLTTAGCADKATTAGDPLPPAKPQASATASVSPQGATATSTAIAANLWTSIKDSNYDARDQFTTGVTRLETEVRDQIVALNAKRATMSGTTDTKAWDFAMKEMAEAQSYLRSSGAELSKSSSENWSQAKEKVGQAWMRTQDAYAKVKASTTS